jgi:hypothetical protein
VGGTLQFDSDWRLRSGEAELARVQPLARPAFARVSAGASVLEVVRRRRSGWRFLLVEPAGMRVVYDFRPSLLRRGGTIAGEGEVIELHPRRRGASSWLIVAPGHAPIEVARSAGWIEQQGEQGRRVHALAAGIEPRLELTAEDQTALAGCPPALLAFACWLIVRWEMTPNTVA